MLSQEDYEEELEESARLVDQRFGTKGCPLLHGGLDVDQVIEKVESLELEDEVVHFGRLGIFWGNSLKNHTTKQPITNTCSRCLSTQHHHSQC